MERLLPRPAITGWEWTLARVCLVRAQCDTHTLQYACPHTLLFSCTQYIHTHTMHTYTCIHMHTYICIHTHTHTHICTHTDVAREREVEGDLFLWDMGDGMGFRPGTFDGVISISALQWLCNADKSYHHPPKRLYKFFSSLYACMVSF